MLDCGARSHAVPSLGSSLPVEGVEHTTKLSMRHASTEILGKWSPREAAKERNGWKLEYQQKDRTGKLEEDPQGKSRASKKEF